MLNIEEYQPQTKHAKWVESERLIFGDTYVKQIFCLEQLMINGPSCFTEGMLFSILGKKYYDDYLAIREELKSKNVNAYGLAEEIGARA